MSEIRLDIPEGFFEDSFSRTMASVSRVRSRRIGIASAAAALLVIAGSCLWYSSSMAEKRFHAEQAQMVELDIFLEINQ